MNFAALDNLIQRDVANGFPGVALSVIYHGQIVYQQISGSACKYSATGKPLNIADYEPLLADTYFDLASNTKIYATTLALLQLVTQNKINLSDSVTKFYPTYINPTVTISQLMSHSAGYAPEVWFFDPTAAGAEFYSLKREMTQDLLLHKVPLVYTPGAQHLYSDSGFILLGFIIEQICGMSLDEFVKQEIYVPLGLIHTTFNPLTSGVTAGKIAATSLGNACNGSMNYPLMRTGLIRGEVQDEKAFYCCGGVAGHAGLFSTLGDMLQLTQLILNHGALAGKEIFSADVLQEFGQSSLANPSFACGWRKVAYPELRNSFGSYPSPESIGHTGFCGTLTLVDFANELAIVLLTNKVHSPALNRQQYQGSSYACGKYAPVVDEIYHALGLAARNYTTI